MQITAKKNIASITIDITFLSEAKIAGIKRAMESAYGVPFAREEGALVAEINQELVESVDIDV